MRGELIETKFGMFCVATTQLLFVSVFELPARAKDHNRFHDCIQVRRLAEEGSLFGPGVHVGTADGEQIVFDDFGEMFIRYELSNDMKIGLLVVLSGWEGGRKAA